MKHFDRW